MRSRLPYILLLLFSFVIGINMGGVGQHSTQPPEEEMSVKTYKINQPKPVFHPIRLISPPHRSTLSNGVVTFQWEFAKRPKKSNLTVELVDIEKASTRILKARDTQKRYSMDSGFYKWRVVDTKNKYNSNWRSFKVVNMTYTGPSTIGKSKFPELSNAKPKPRQALPPIATALPIRGVSSVDTDDKIEKAGDGVHKPYKELVPTPEMTQSLALPFLPVSRAP